MLGRVHRLFQRYAARHLTLTARGPQLYDATGARVGQIDQLALRNDRLALTGQAEADLVVLELGGRRRVVAPGDAAGLATGLRGQRRFQVELPYLPAPARLILTRAGQQAPAVLLPDFGTLRFALARAALLPGFLWAGVRALPAVLRWFRFHDMAARERVKLLLGLGPVVEEQRLEPAQFPPPPSPQPAVSVAVSAARIHILLPVYQAFDLLPEVLDRITRHTDLPWQLTVIEDASPDPAIRPYLRHWAQDKPQVQLIENQQNLGFIGAMNRGLAAALAAADQSLPDHPAMIVLLNSDALVPQDWASRLVAPLYADPRVASVTPMSNEAELMSVPVICAPTALRPGAGDAIDRVARRLPQDLGLLAEAPTGVGFCMALNPAYLRLEPQLDPAFGRGYGEEVDWCQKVLARGGRHLCLTGLFVEHRGGASFGAAAKQALLQRNGAMISARYPRFDADVQRFIGDDPLLTSRLALGLAWAATLGAAVPVYLAHAMGGGAEHYLADRLARDLAQGPGAAVVLRVGGNFRWEIALHSPAGVTRGGTGDRGLLLRLLRLLPMRAVIYSCGVADADPVDLPGLLLELAQNGAGAAAAGDHSLELLFHDYLPLSPSYTLTGSDGAYHGVPQPGTADRAHSVIRPDGARVGLADWRAAWGRLMAAADRVTVFSASSRDIVLAAYPAVAPRLQVVPHQLLTAVPRLKPARSARVVIGVLGNIGGHKGAAVLAALSKTLRADLGLVVLGKFDPSYKLRRPARVHGGYHPAEIAELAQHYGISCWLIPSVWPETFSYTTHEALATGLPVICFDLGAQAEAVRAALAQGAAGAVLPLARPAEAAGAIRAAALSFAASSLPLSQGPQS